MDVTLKPLTMASQLQVVTMSDQRPRVRAPTSSPKMSSEERSGLGAGFNKTHHEAAAFGESEGAAAKSDRAFA